MIRSFDVYFEMVLRQVFRFFDIPMFFVVAILADSGVYLPDVSTIQ